MVPTDGNADERVFVHPEDFRKPPHASAILLDCIVRFFSAWRGSLAAERMLA